MSPVATGGTKSGNITSVSINAFPGHDRRANNHARPIPKGRIMMVLSAEILMVKKTTCHASPVMAFCYLAIPKPIFSNIARASALAKKSANFLARSESLEDLITAMG